MNLHFLCMLEGTFSFDVAHIKVMPALEKIKRKIFKKSLHVFDLYD